MMNTKRTGLLPSMVVGGMLATMASASAVAAASDAYLKGTFGCVNYHADSNGTSITEHGAYAIATVDGLGNLSFTITQNDNGVISAGSFLGTYSVSADGTTTVYTGGDSETGALSADGNVLVLTRLTAAKSPNIIVCNRQGAVGLANNPSGILALNSNTTGYFNNAAGFNALFANTTGYNNNAQGSYALAANTTGYGNSAMGANSLTYLTTGFRNVGVGNNTGTNLTAGNYNVDIGWGVTGPGDETGVVRIGNPAHAAQAYIAGINNSQVSGSPVYVTAGGQLGVLASSERYKTDIKSLGSESEKLQQLRAVTFRLKSEPNGALQYGLIAEEVNKVYPELVIRDGQGEIQGLRYDELAPILLIQVQQQQLKLQEQQQKLAEVDRLTERLGEVDQLRQQLAELKRANESMQAAIAQLLTRDVKLAMR